MNDRIKEVREDQKLSRAAFGKRLGVSGDVINNLERGRVEAKDPIIKLICTEYSVNEDWLRTGNGSMYVEPDTFSLDEFVKQHGATEIELQIMKTYFELPPDVREMLVEHFRNAFAGTAAVSSAPAAAAPAADIPASGMTVEEAEELYKKSVLSSAQNMGFTASSITSDTSAEKKAANEN